VKRQVAVYTILFALGIAGMLIYRYFTKGETVEIWEIVLTLPVLPLAGIALWLRYDWWPAKIREGIEKTERDWKNP